MTELIIRPSNISLKKGTTTRFDGNLKQFSLATPAQIIKSDVTIAFPDIVKSDMYYWTGQFVHDSLTGAIYYYEGAQSVINAVQQDWGPDRGGSYYLAPTLLGTVPAGTDFLDLQVSISRTANPSQRFGKTITPHIPPSGGFMNCRGGSALLEDVNVFKRGFAVVVDGTNVYLRRYQSVTQQIYSDADFWSSGNSPDNVGRWTYGANGKGVGMSIRANRNYAYNGSGTSFYYKRNGSSHLPYDDNTNYAATYTATLIITPGNYRGPA